MDPVHKLYLYQQWIGDQRDDAELAKNTAYLIGSFQNPEAVKKLLSDDTYELSDEEVEASLEIVKSGVINVPGIAEKMATVKGKEQVSTRKRKRRVQTQG